MTDDRPKFLDFTKMRFPMAALVSILHRVSGVVLFLVLPGFLLSIQMTVYSEIDYLVLSNLMKIWWMKVIVALSISAICFHLIAGIRHLLADVGVAESLKGARLSALLTFLLWLMVTGLIGLRVWS